MKPKVAVIIPCFNQGRFLAEAVESALCQQNVFVEVIVIDDGSSDDTQQVCQNFGDRIISVRQKNAGLAVARNAGILASSGEYIQFLDADDRILPGKFAAQVKALEMEPNAAVAWSQGFIIDTNGRRIERAKVNHPTGEVLHSLLTMWGTLVPAVLVRRSALARVGLFDTDPSIKGCEDLDLWMRLARQFPFVSLPDEHFEYRASNGQMSSKLEMMLRSGLRVLERYSHSHGNCAECRRAAREGRRRWKTVAAFGLMSQAREAIRTGDRRGAMQKLAQVVRLHPAHLLKTVSPAHWGSKLSLLRPMATDVGKD